MPLKLFISSVNDILRDLPMSPVARTEEMDVDRITSLVLNIDAGTVRVGQWHIET